MSDNLQEILQNLGKFTKTQGQNGAISQHPERVTVRKVDPCNQSPRNLRDPTHLHSLEKFDK